MKPYGSLEAEKTRDGAKLINKIKNDEEEIEKTLSLENEKLEKVTESNEQESNWDGSESEFVEDEKAPEYEDRYSGIKFQYALKPEEILACVKHCGISKNFKLFVDVALFLFSILFLVLYIKTMNVILLFCFIIFAVLLLLWGLNVFHTILKRLQYKRMSGNRKLSLEIYPDSIIVENENRKMEIKLDGSNVFEEYENMFLIYLPRQRVFIIPTRAIEPEFLADIQAMLIAGTTPISKSILGKRGEG